MMPGDLVLTHRKGFYSKAILFGQNLRFRGNRRRYAHWTHAAIVITKDGMIVEALGRGVTISHISKYKDVETRIIPIMGDTLALNRVVRFAAHAVGRKYGFLEILSLGFYLLTGTKIRFGVDNQMICSGLAASALSRTNAIFPHEPCYMMPADLAEYYEV